MTGYWRSASDDPCHGAAFGRGFQPFLMPQDFPAGKDLQEFAGAQDEIGIVRPAGKGSGAAEGSHHGQSAGAHRGSQVRHQ